MSIVHFRYHHCNSLLELDAANCGRPVRCLACQHVTICNEEPEEETLTSAKPVSNEVTRLPKQAPEPFNFDEPQSSQREIETLRTPQGKTQKATDTRAVNRKRIWHLVTGALLVSALVILIVFLAQRKTPRDVAKKNQDFFLMQEKNLEWVGIVALADFWNSQAALNPGFGDAGALNAQHKLVSRCLILAQEYDFKIVAMNKEFLENYGVDSKEWKAEFDKQFSGRRQIWDEVRVVVKKDCQLQLHAIHRHFADVHTRLLAELRGKATFILQQEYDVYRSRYMEDNADQMIDKTLSLVRQLTSLKNLKAKVFAKRK